MEVKTDKDVLQELPVDRVISFSEIDLDGASWDGSFGLIASHDLRGKVDIVHDTPSRDKSRLGLVDKLREEGLHPFAKDLGDHFVGHIAACDGSEIAHFRVTIRLRDKGDDGGVEGLEKSPGVEEFLDRARKIPLDGRLVLLEEGRGKTVGTRGFAVINAEQGLLDFLRGDLANKIHLLIFVQPVAVFKDSRVQRVSRFKSTEEILVELHEARDNFILVIHDGSITPT